MFKYTVMSVRLFYIKQST